MATDKLSAVAMATNSFFELSCKKAKRKLEKAK
jgi:hypothetical protein